MLQAQGAAEGPAKADIRDVLNRRADLSTFVVHLSRDTDQKADANLTAIILEQRLKAATRMGWASDVADDPHDPDKRTQRAVSFTETPLEHIYSHIAPIEGRHLQFRPYGLAFTKMQARSYGVNPVMYVGSVWGKHWTVPLALDSLREEAKGKDFHDSPVADVLPFVEPMFTYPPSPEKPKGSQNEWWWEREWRHVGDLYFKLSDVAFWLSPEEDIDVFERILAEEHAKHKELQGLRVLRCVDPRWGLERVIAHLGGLPVEAISPFSTR